MSRQRRLLSDGLKRLGFKVYKSDADFILFHSKLPLYDILLNKGILIRDCSNYVGLSEGYFRVAVKTYDENVRLLKVIGECIEKIKQLEPMEIEKRSFEIISHELSEMQITLPADQEMITKESYTRVLILIIYRRLNTLMTPLLLQKADIRGR